MHNTNYPFSELSIHTESMLLWLWIYVSATILIGYKASNFRSWDLRDKALFSKALRVLLRHTAFRCASFIFIIRCYSKLYSIISQLICLILAASICSDRYGPCQPDLSRRRAVALVGAMTLCSHYCVGRTLQKSITPE